MAPPKPKLPPPAEPRYSRAFDPWHSVGAGHQRAETSGSGGWRDSRNLKMNSQFRAGNSGGPGLSDTVGVGSQDFDERLGMLVPKEVRARAMNSVVGMLRNPGTMKAAASRPASSSSTASAPRTGSPPLGLGDEPQPEAGSGPQHGATAEGKPVLPELGEEDTAKQTPAERRIFESLVIYVNGSTLPHVSDHRLKHLLSEHGARISLHLGRRQVTHVILGKPSGPNGGAGGGLAGGKLEREIRRVGGCGIKFVGVEWVLESIKASRRLPEARFANLKIAARRQQTVLGAFEKPSGSLQQPAARGPAS
ncbi:hypothetical protein C8A05DRAFT_32080 [Staphylotrichum tortipilum]|uniref:BRCT domain-containing protein n=1 Tax=Staphylotrichum tortipilum TaxID=2831512 RepID=A0AAN6MNI1_9PEZI|nr:hypothetical protein C8A05DRAFT_32080 [Staphylotrichum longicolle]